MTNDARDATRTAATRLISVVDAVCCVYFCAAGRSSLLLKILVGLGMEILVPAEVEREVLGKHLGQTADHWRRLRSSPRVRILDELTAVDPRADVVATVVRLRRMSVQLALSTRRDLGEAVVIGHAKVLADAGHEVYVVVDDQGGQRLATNEGLTVLTVEDLLIAALALGLVHPEKLRRTYEEMIPFGCGLPTWDASTMKHRHAEWRRAQQATRG